MASSLEETALEEQGGGGEGEEGAGFMFNLDFWLPAISEVAGLQTVIKWIWLESGDYEVETSESLEVMVRNYNRKHGMVYQCIYYLAVNQLKTGCEFKSEN